jgi:hypothetical protein
MATATIRALLARPPLQDYRNRSYIGDLLDNRVFDALIADRTIRAGDYMLSGCLDALDNIPAGSMVAVPGNCYDQSMVTRGRTLKEEQEFEAFMLSLDDDIDETTGEKNGG